MDSKDIITLINKAVDELDFVSARKFIEENIEFVDQNRARLKSNAREILLFLKNKLASGEKPLTKTELTKINAINIYAARFDLRGLKLSIIGNEQLFLKKETLSFLNADAKVLLEGMGTVKIDFSD